MEVVAEAGPQQPWGQFKEEVEIMEEEHGGGGGGADAVEELLTREIRKRLDHAHGSSNGNGNGNGAHHANGGEEEEEDDASGGEEEDHANGGEDEEGGEAEEQQQQQQQHKSILLDPAKVPDIITEVSARYLVTGTMRYGAEKEDANGTLTPKGKGLEAHENGNGEINHGPGNGKLENGSHSNGSHQVPNDGEPKIEYMFEINKTEIYPTEVDKDENTAEAQPKVEEYDLEKILDQQETHDLFCPNCKSCITRRVILKKRKRIVRTTPTDEPSKRPNIEGVVPSVTLPDRVEEESPDVFRCLSCFSFFIPTGCSFNIFRIFGRRDVDGQPDVLPPPASEDMPPRSENCTSWLLSCFQPGDSPNQPTPASDPAMVPLLSDTQSSNNTTTRNESSTSYVHLIHETVLKPEHVAVESPSKNQAPADSPRSPPLPDIETPSGTTTTTTETNESYGEHSHVTDELTVKSSYHTTTTTVTSETDTTSSTTNTGASSQTSYATGTGEMPPPNPVSDAIIDATQHKDVHRTVTTTFENGFSTQHNLGVKVDGPNVTNIPRENIPTLPNPQPANPDHVAVSVFGDVNQVAPRPQQRDDWDILKAIVYGGLVESITSLSVVSAAASSGAKTLDIFILGIANLIGGLPLIFHNIADLRDIRDGDRDNERVGHYWLQLGRRSKARLHMVMALISYMVFGLLPPVLYGLSFRESNDRENKMMSVAGASLACIALLALGKAHVHRRPRTYFKTLVYYLTIAVSSSGLSYVAGVLITRLLVHYGIIEEGGSAAPAPPGLSSPFAYAADAESSAWASF